MPRKLTLFLNEGGERLEVTLHKIDRENLYGKLTVEKRVVDGEKLTRVPVTQDGAHFLSQGSLSLLHVTEEGKYTPTVIPTDLEGQPLPTFPSMFDGVSLQRTITLEQFFEYNFSKVYLLQDATIGEDISPAWDALRERCENLLAEEQFLVFQYAWRPTAFPEDAVLVIAEDRNLFALIGKSSPVAWARLNVNLAQIFEEAESENELPEFDFDYW
ncbi:MAG TPA: hypothetical protein VKK79_11995 [Candidatus Lokiarchaeia archaeon]|nr:hypothetical protein [Candidatus Lokiarchaeia archaeon]